MYKEKEKDTGDRDFSWIKLACPSCAIYYGIKVLISGIRNRRTKSK